MGHHLNYQNKSVTIRQKKKVLQTKTLFRVKKERPLDNYAKTTGVNQD